jgi:hypothetical protein
MATLERAIYSVTYYWHGISQRGVQGILWLYDKLHHLELFQWSNVNGLPYNQVIDNKIEDMIGDGHLRVVNRWSKKFGISGLEPIQKNSTLKVYKVSEKFSERFRQSVTFYINHTKKFKQLYNLYEERPIPVKTFYDYIYDELRS